MKRVVTLDGSTARDRRRYEMLHHGMLQAPPPTGRNVDTFRREASVLKKLEALGQEDPAITDNPPGVPPRTLRPTECRLELEQPELDLLLGYLVTVPWLPRVSPDVVDLLDVLAAAERVD